MRKRAHERAYAACGEISFHVRIKYDWILQRYLKFAENREQMNSMENYLKCWKSLCFLWPQSNAPEIDEILLLFEVSVQWIACERERKAGTECFSNSIVY